MDRAWLSLAGALAGEPHSGFRPFPWLVLPLPDAADR